MTFDDLMNCCEDNKYNFRNLMKCLNANSIIPVFGSGISANLYPTWRNLLIKIAHKQGKEKEVNDFLNTDELEDAAEYIYNYMGGNTSGAFYRELEKILNPEDFSLDKLPGELKLIPAVFKNSIMTTNFDVVLDKIFENEKIDIEKVFIQSEFFKTRIDSSLPRSERLLIKLHGDIRYKNSLIFTKSSYDEAYGKTNVDLGKIMPKMLKGILESKVILFIGCGLSNDRIMNVLKCCSPNATYYALLELPKETVNKDNVFEPKLRNGAKNELIKVYQDRKNYIDRHNIIPIWFPYKQYKAVPVFLKELANQSSTSIKKEAIQLTNPPIKTTNNFIHRNGEIEDLSKLIISKQKELLSNKEKNIKNTTILIKGIGGIGKTTIARSLYYKLKNSFTKIAWVNYDQNFKDSLITSFILNQNFKDENEKYNYIITLLNNSANDILLFIDNLSKTPIEDKELNLVRTFDNVVVITSRLSELEGCDYYNVPFLTKEQSEEVFCSYYNKNIKTEDLEVVKELVNLVSCHTLSIELLAKAANSPEYTLSEYLQLLKRKGFEYPKLRTYTDHAQQDQTIAEHLSKLFSLEEVSEGCQKILKYFMIMPSIEIPKEVYKWIECDINDLIYLIRSGWINETENGYIMSDVIKLSLQLQSKGKEVKWEDYKQILSYMSSNKYIREDDIFTTVIPRLQIANSFIEEFSNEETEQMAELLNNIGIAYNSQGEYNKALNLCKRALEISKKVLGENYSAIATVYNNIGRIYAKQGNYKEALNFYQKALEISKKVLGENHPDTANSYNNIGFVYNSQGNYKEALNLYQRALEIRKKVLGENYPDTANSYNNIGLVYSKQGNYKEALNFYQKALEIERKVLGENHPDTAIIYNNIGGVCSSQGNYKEALNFYQKALEIEKKVLGENHPDTANSYNNIGFVYNSQGNYKEALNFYQKALKIRKKGFC